MSEKNRLPDKQANLSRLPPCTSSRSRNDLWEAPRTEQGLSPGDSVVVLTAATSQLRLIDFYGIGLRKIIPQLG